MDLQTLLEAKIIDQTVEDLTTACQTLAIALAPAFLILNMLFNFASHALKGQPRFFDWTAIVRCLVIMTIIGLYSALMLPITTLIGLTVNAFEPDAMLYNAKDIAAKLDASEKVNEKANDAAPSPFSYISDAYDSFTNFAGNIMNSIITYLASAISLFIYFLMKFLIIMIVKVLYIFGPLALAISIIPMFKDQMNSWLGSFISNSCVLITQKVLLCIQYSALFSSFYALKDGATADSPTLTLVFNVVIIAMHVSVFWLTKQWIGSASAGAVFSNAINAVSTAAGMKLGSMAGSTKNLSSNNSEAEKVADAFSNKS